MPFSDQVLGLGAGLLTAYLTGTWRKYGHRLERLHELRQALPAGDELRDAFDRQATEEARRLIARGLVRPPAGIVVSRLAVRSVITLWVLLAALAAAGSRPWVALGREVGRQSHQPGGPPLWAVVTNDLIIYSSVPVFLVAGSIWLNYWYGKLGSPTPRQRVQHALLVAVFVILWVGVISAVASFYSQGVTRLGNAVERPFPLMLQRVLFVTFLAGLGVRKAWKMRRGRS